MNRLLSLRIRTAFFIFLFSVAMPAAGAKGFPPLGFGADAGVLQDVFIKTGTGQIYADLRADLSDEFQIRVPAAFTFTSGFKSGFLEAGIHVVCYPFSNLGLFMGMSVVQLGAGIKAAALEKSYYVLNEVEAGWTFSFRNGIFIEPSVTVRDPSGTFADGYSELRGVFPSYKTFRIRLAAGWKKPSKESK